MPVVEIEALRLLAMIRRRPWRAVVAAEARRDPDRFGTIAGPEAAAALDCCRTRIAAPWWSATRRTPGRAGRTVLVSPRCCPRHRSPRPRLRRAERAPSPPAPARSRRRPSPTAASTVLLHDSLDAAPEMLPAAAAL
jgi:hypothetical protein